MAKKFTIGKAAFAKISEVERPTPAADALDVARLVERLERGCDTADEGCALCDEAAALIQSLAARVERAEKTTQAFFEREQEQMAWRNRDRKDLTAANARVGELEELRGTENVLAEGHIAEALRQRDAARAEAIEECAKLVEEHEVILRGDDPLINEKIAAAIRALASSEGKDG